MQNLSETTPSDNGQTIEAPSNRVLAPAPDPFDPLALRLDQNFGAIVDVKRVLTTIPCRKPNRHEFVRVRPGDEWRVPTGVFEDKANREVYLVERPLWPELHGEVRPVCLYFAITRQGDVMLWPCKLSVHEGRGNTWNDSALEAAKLAETRWIRLAANQSAGIYDVYEAAAELSEPQWPGLSFSEVLRLSFKDRFIRSTDHPIVRQIRGEV